jgi:hypothetical protein
MSSAALINQWLADLIHAVREFLILLIWSKVTAAASSWPCYANASKYITIFAAALSVKIFLITLSWFILILISLNTNSFHSARE